MKHVKIKSIQLTNFKGIRSFEVRFNEKTTSIYGRNASGKTTIFDAFTWLLFGKNSDDKKQFNIKTLDGAGNVIEKLPHEVSAIITVDGQEIRLTKRLKEKWVKKRGSADEEFKGNEEERLYNDVPMSVKDWSEKINAICSEESFKMLTTPLYFTSLRWDKQREALIQMAGDVSLDDVISTNKADFGALIDSLNGKSFDEFKREISAKKKRIKEEVDTLPSRIDERRRDCGNVYDWSLLEARLHHKETKFKEIDEQLTSVTSAINKVSDDTAKIAEERAKIATDIALCKKQIEGEIRTAEQSRMTRWSNGLRRITDTEQTIAYNNSQIERLNKQLTALQLRRSVLLAKWKEIKANTLQFDEQSFVCPTCGRTLDIEQIEEKQAEIRERFNAAKAKDLEENKRQGLEVREEIEQTQKRIDGFVNDNDTLMAELEKLKSEIGKQPQICTDEDITKMIIKDEKYLRLCKRLSDFDKKHAQMPTLMTDEQGEIEELKKQRKQIDDEIAEIKVQLSMKKVNDANIRRINELEEQLRNASEELAQLEGIEYTIQQFTKTRIEMLESRINSMFSFVKFKMFDQQINGGEVETCKAMVNGVPYDDLNNAMKINCGLDIINALCKKLQMTAPIFVDNSESINNIIETESQIIKLIVSEDDVLKIA